MRPVLDVSHDRVDRVAVAAFGMLGPQGDAAGKMTRLHLVQLDGPVNQAEDLVLVDGHPVTKDPARSHLRPPARRRHPATARHIMHRLEDGARPRHLWRSLLHRSQTVIAQGTLHWDRAWWILGTRDYRSDGCRDCTRARPPFPACRSDRPHRVDGGRNAATPRGRRVAVLRGRRRRPSLRGVVRTTARRRHTGRRLQGGSGTWPGSCAGRAGASDRLGAVGGRAGRA